MKSLSDLNQKIIEYIINIRNSITSSSKPYEVRLFNLLINLIESSTVLPLNTQKALNKALIKALFRIIFGALIWDLIGALFEALIKKQNKNEKTNKVIIPKPPGRQLTSLLQAICTKRIFESVFAQVIADAREEYFEALFEKKFKLARWRKIQLYLVIIATGFSLVSISAVKKIITIYKTI